MNKNGDALCNFCNGPMPCYCDPPKNIDEQIEQELEDLNNCDLKDE